MIGECSYYSYVSIGATSLDLAQQLSNVFFNSVATAFHSQNLLQKNIFCNSNSCKCNKKTQ